MELPKYREGTNVKVDLWICGFPRAKVLEVLKPGSGRYSGGKVRVKLLEACRGFAAGEIIDKPTSMVVPLKHIRVDSVGFYRINVNYEWVTDGKESQKGQEKGSLRDQN